MEIVDNVKVYGLDESLIASGYPMRSKGFKEMGVPTEKDLNRARKLANTPIGEGHDNFLQGVVVQFDLNFTNKAWVEMQRYHYVDFVSSESSMHCITKFNLDERYIKYVDPDIIKIMKQKIAEYNSLSAMNKEEFSMETAKELQRKYLEILYSNPAGFIITARMTTNYRQLKTIYKQRKNHKLPEWRAFCLWVESLPHADLIVGE